MAAQKKPKIAPKSAKKQFKVPEGPFKLSLACGDNKRSCLMRDLLRAFASSRETKSNRPTLLPIF